MVVTVTAPMDWMSVGFWDMFYMNDAFRPFSVALWAEQFHFIGEETSSETWVFAQGTKSESGSQFCVQTVFSYSLSHNLLCPRSLDTGTCKPLGRHEDFPRSMPVQKVLRESISRFPASHRDLSLKLIGLRPTPPGPRFLLPPPFSQSPLPHLIKSHVFPDTDLTPWYVALGIKTSRNTSQKELFEIGAWEPSEEGTPGCPCLHSLFPG